MKTYLHGAVNGRMASISANAAGHSLRLIRRAARRAVVLPVTRLATQTAVLVIAQSSCTAVERIQDRGSGALEQIGNVTDEENACDAEEVVSKAPIFLLCVVTQL